MAGVRLVRLFVFEALVTSSSSSRLIIQVILPGGVREAMFGDENYQILWGERIGFAKVALEAKIPIIPIFTKNCREAFRTISFGRNILLKLYEIIRLPCVVMYGGFPVKLVT